MMLLLLQLAKRRPCISPFSTAAHAAQPNLRCYSSPTTPNPNPNFTVVDYFIASFGFSPDKAAKVSNPVAHLKSPEKPDAVLRFLTHHGFSESDIKSIITWRPTILCTSPEKTLEPNLRALRGMGLSGPTVIQIVLSSPVFLLCGHNLTVPRIKFWIDFLGGDEAALIKVLKQNRELVGHDITRLIAPRISLLQSYGLSIKDIQRVVCRPGIIMRNVGVLEDMLNRTKDLGFHPSSGLFVIGLEVMACVTREALQKKMNFLLGEARCDISYIISHPKLLQLSLTKRLRPRLHVLNLLESKGLSISGQGFHTVMKLTNTQFVERYVLQHKDEFPELGDICLTDRA